MEIVIIAAIDEKGAVGLSDNKTNHDLPWPRNSSDMEHFSRQTRGNVVVMGHNTHKNLKKLNERTVFILSRTNTHKKRPEPEKALWFSDSKDLLKHYKEKFSDKILFIIGGPTVWEHFLGLEVVAKLIITSIPGEHEANVFFERFLPENLAQQESGWKLESTLVLAGTQPKVQVRTWTKRLK
ncbi:MAG: dihydrofolate reductase [Patescibacteria group bacterium]|nr:dihydrofolate reductase [Patescibacteria group bacterium]